MSNDRCSICNSVSSFEIMTNPEDHVWRRHPMKVDPRDVTALICYECQGVLEDVDKEWLDEDEEDYQEEYEENSFLFEETPY